MVAITEKSPNNKRRKSIPGGEGSPKKVKTEPTTPNKQKPQLKTPKKTPPKSPFQKTPAKTPIQKNLQKSPKQTPAKTPIQKNLQKTPNQTPAKTPIQKNQQKTPKPTPAKNVGPKTPQAKKTPAKHSPNAKPPGKSPKQLQNGTPSPKPPVKRAANSESDATPAKKLKPFPGTAELEPKSPLPTKKDENEVLPKVEKKLSKNAKKKAANGDVKRKGFFFELREQMKTDKDATLPIVIQKLEALEARKKKTKTCKRKIRLLANLKATLDGKPKAVRSVPAAKLAKAKTTPKALAAAKRLAKAKANPNARADAKKLAKEKQKLVKLSKSALKKKPLVAGEDESDESDLEAANIVVGGAVKPKKGVATKKLAKPQQNLVFLPKKAVGKGPKVVAGDESDESDLDAASIFAGGAVKPKKGATIAKGNPKAIALAKKLAKQQQNPVKLPKKAVGKGPKLFDEGESDESGSEASDYDVEGAVKPDKVATTTAEDDSDVSDDEADSGDEEDDSGDEEDESGEEEEEGDDSEGDDADEEGVAKGAPKKTLKPKKGPLKPKGPPNLKRLKEGGVVDPRQKRYVLYVANVDYNAGRLDIVKHFSKIGFIRNVRIPLDKNTNRPRGFAYVEVDNEETFQRGLSMHETQLNGRQLKVMVSESGKKKTDEKKKFVKQKNMKLHAMRKEGMLAGSVKQTQKRSFRRNVAKAAAAKENGGA